MMRKHRFSPPTYKELVLLALLSIVDGSVGARVILGLVNECIADRVGRWWQAGELERMKLETLRVVLSRLKRDGLLANDQRETWRLTQKGKVYAGPFTRKRIYREWQRKLGRPRLDTVIVFDVPELERKKRDYLRLELMDLGYIPFQKSAWIGPGPIPRAFIDYLSELALLRYVHIFSIKKEGTLSTAL